MQAENIEGFRLSPPQKYLWALQQGDESAYRSQCLILIEGNLNSVVLRRAIRSVVGRHDLLRTVFHQVAGMSFPLQVVEEQSNFAIEEHDLSSLDPREQTTRVEELYREAGLAPFDPTQSPLLRVSLIVESQQRHLLLVSLPSLCADLRTLENILNEIGRGYSAGLINKDIEDEPVQFADLAEWQNELLESEESAVGRQYWLKQDSVCAERPRSSFREASAALNSL